MFMGQSLKPFFTIEGLPGVGKTTVAEYLAERYMDRFSSATLLTESGPNSLTDDEIDIIENSDRASPIREPITMERFFRCRRDLENVILPSLGNGHSVFCERFSDQIDAEEHYGWGVAAKRIADFQSIITVAPAPMMTFVIDAPPEVAYQRFSKTAGDRRKMRPGLVLSPSIALLRYMSNVRNGYLDIARKNPNHVVVDATQGVMDVCRQAWTALRQSLEQRAAA
jgi:dTMP kinase